MSDIERNDLSICRELTEMLTSLTRESKELERLKRELSGLDPQAVSGADRLAIWCC